MGNTMHRTPKPTFQIVEQERATEPRSDSYSKDKRAVVAWGAAALGGIGICVGGWAHEKLWTHSVTLERIDTIQTEQNRRIDKIDSKLDQILDELRKRP